MRTIPFFLISLSLMVAAACTTEPKRPPDPIPEPVLSCAEQCTKNTDCWADSRCNKDHRCEPIPGDGKVGAACAKASDCKGFLCTDKVCTACQANEDCAAFPKGQQVCTALGTCGECADNTDCSDTTRNIDNPNGHICGAGGTCQCHTDDVCKSRPAYNKKDPKSGDGLGLCRAEGCVCDRDVACTTGAKECSQGMDGKFTGVCVACETDAHCTDDDGDPSTPFGSKCFKSGPRDAAAYCGCKADAECASGHCKVDDGTCLDCVKNADCKGNPAGEICSGGTCVQCDPANDKDGMSPDCMSTGRGNTCDVSTGSNVCTCAGDTDCKPNVTGTSLKWVCE